MPTLYPTAHTHGPASSRKNQLPSGRYISPETGKPVPSVTEILSDSDLVESYPGIPEETLHNKGRIGSRVHAEIERILRGEARTPALRDDRTNAYMRCWSTWWLMSSFVVRAVEIRGISRLYAGTVDLVCTEVEEWIVRDWKTRDPKPYDGYQLAAYAMLVAGVGAVPGFGPQEALEARREIVSLSETRRAKVQRFDDPHDFEVFRGALTTWWARERLWPGEGESFL